jgi:hypothetical protein
MVRLAVGAMLKNIPKVSACQVCMNMVCTNSESHNSITFLCEVSTQGKLYTATAHTEEDARLLEYYQQLAEENNTYRFLVDGESTWYPSTSNRDRNLTDRYGRDAELFETFGQIHAANMFYILSHHLKETDDDPSSIYDKGGVETEEGVMVGKVLKEMPTFSSLKNRLESPKLVNILSDYCAGGPMGFFDGQSQGKLQDSHLVCIDISALGNEYSKMFAMSVMLAWLWDKFAKPHKEIKKHIVVDEAWLFMNYKYSAVFLSQIARRGAKYNTSLMAASQSFREFLTQEGITFLNQCDTKFFLRMQKNDALALGDLFGLSPQLIERIIAFPNGRGVLRAGNESAVIQFKGFAFEEEFLESNPEAVVSR